MKIDIEINDISLFAHVAITLDRPAIQQAIIELRKKWTGGKLYPNFDSWKNTGVKINFPQDILKILNENNISPIFLYVFEEAIVTNKVTHFTRVLRVPIPRKVLAEYLPLTAETLQKDDYEYVLVTPPEAERNEVEEEYASMKRDIKDTAKLDSPFDVLNQPLTQNPKASFKNAREWYWMYLEEQSSGQGKYNRILDKWNAGKEEEDCEFSVNVVEKAVSNYKKLLKI